MKKNEERNLSIDSVNNENFEIEDKLQTLIDDSSEGLKLIEELKAKMEQIAAAAEDNAGAAKESLSAITEIKQNSKYLEIETKEVLDVINSFKLLLDTATQNINDVSDNLKDISLKSTNISENTNKLFEASKKITDAVNLITKLSKKQAYSH
jgi:methyl-accepting chemotaxis protein